MQYRNFGRSFFRFVIMHALDRQTDKRTDRQTERPWQWRELHYMQSHGKKKLQTHKNNVIGILSPKCQTNKLQTVQRFLRFSTSAKEVIFYPAFVCLSVSNFT